MKFILKRYIWRILHTFRLLPLYFTLAYWLRPNFSRSKKVFCIGRNKTGTTSVEVLLSQLGYKISPRLPSELLVDDWARGKFKGIVTFSKYAATGFKDMPYSLPETYIHLEKAFPEAKFILTTRPTDEWYDSVLRYTMKIHGTDSLPTREELRNSTYVRKGWAYENIKRILASPDDDLYNKDILTRHYEDYNKAVMAYFANKPEKLLVVDVSSPGSAKEISDFLEADHVVHEMPWVNKT